MSADDTLAFLAVAQFGGFTAAAARVGQPKSNLVRRVRSLETRLGVRLFERTTRALFLTEAGHAYRDALGGWGERLAEAEEAVKEVRGDASGWIRISLPYSLAAGLMAPIFAQFSERYPHICFDLALDHRVADLVSDDVDIALRLGPLRDSSLLARRLAKLPNRIYAAPGYLSRRGVPSQPEDLYDHATLANRIAKRNNGHAWGLSNGGPLMDFTISPVIVADDPTALLGALTAGRGLMLVTDGLVKPLLDEGRIVPVLENWVGRSPELHALFPRGRIQFLKTRLFVDFLTEQFSRLSI